MCAFCFKLYLHFPPIFLAFVECLKKWIIPMNLIYFQHKYACPFTLETLLGGFRFLNTSNNHCERNCYLEGCKVLPFIVDSCNHSNQCFIANTLTCQGDIYRWSISYIVMLVTRAWFSKHPGDSAVSHSVLWCTCLALVFT